VSVYALRASAGQRSYQPIAGSRLIQLIGTHMTRTIPTPGLRPTQSGASGMLSRCIWPLRGRLNQYVKVGGCRRRHGVASYSGCLQHKYFISYLAGLHCSVCYTSCGVLVMPAEGDEFFQLSACFHAFARDPCKHLEVGAVRCSATGVVSCSIQCCAGEIQMAQ